MKKNESEAVQQTFEQMFLELLDRESKRGVLSKIQVTGLYHSVNETLAQILHHVTEPEQEAEQDDPDYGAGVDLDQITIENKTAVATAQQRGDDYEQD